MKGQTILDSFIVCVYVPFLFFSNFKCFFCSDASSLYCICAYVSICECRLPAACVQVQTFPDNFLKTFLLFFKKLASNYKYITNEVWCTEKEIKGNKMTRDFMRLRLSVLLIFLIIYLLWLQNKI